MDNVDILRDAFNTTQNILQNGIDGIRVIVLYCPRSPSPSIGARCTSGSCVQTAIHSVHDRSDGGLVTTVLEMAFAGNCGIDIDLPDASAADAVEALFSEELGFVLEV